MIFESNILRFEPRGRVKRSLVFALGFSVVLGTSLLDSGVAHAAAGDRARQRAEGEVADIEAAAGGLSTGAKPARRYRPEELVAAADLHLRTNQFDIAIDKLNKVIELSRQGKASQGTEADAQNMLGQAYFSTGQLYSARRHFQIVTDRAEDPAYAGMGGPAASRLVDIALQIQRVESLPDVLARVTRMQERSSHESLKYARAKVLFAMGRYPEAREEAASIVSNSLYGQRATYLRGTALMKEAQEIAATGDANKKPDYRSAIAAFEQATVASPDLVAGRRDAQKITDLAWLAVARLHYEAGSNQQAAIAYQKVPRSSEFFSRALFELAWTYVKLGQYPRGQRALEALSVLDPGLVDGADGELLRGDLLLRAGRFEEAEVVYNEVRIKYEPLRSQVDDYLNANSDPAVYYDKLTAAEIETGHELPGLAVDWAREEAEEDRVFAIVDDVARSRSLVKRSRRIVTLLRASLGSASRAKVFPHVQRQLEEVVSLLNQLAMARMILAQGMDDAASSGSAELGQVRSQRRKLMARLRSIPTNPGNFTVREAQAQKTWNRVSQSLQRLQLEADHLRALVNGLRRVVMDAERHGVRADDAGLERYRLEISENDKDLAVYYDRIDSLRAQVEVGRVQTGFGDDKFIEDDRVRQKFNELFDREVALSTAGGGARYARSIRPVMKRMKTLEGRLSSLRKQLDDEATVRGTEMQAVVSTEAKAIEIYASRLDTMDQHARLLVGEVARSNFVKVGKRITDVVMRADVGLVQKAWEVREEQRHRVRDLLRERAREERFITDELREVLDDASEGEN